MDAVARLILDLLIENGEDMALDVFKAGVKLVRDRVDGKASDAAIMSWLRDAQGPSK